MVSTKAFDLRHFRYVSRLLSVGIPCKLVLAGSLLSVLEGVIFEGVSVSSWHIFFISWFLVFIHWCGWLFCFVLKFPLRSVFIIHPWHFGHISRLLSKCVPFKLVFSWSLLAVFGRVIFLRVSVSSWHVIHLLISCVHLLVWLIELFCAHFYREMLTLWLIEPPTSFRPAVRLAVEPFSIANWVAIPNFDTSASRFLSTFPTTDKIVAASGWARGAIMIGFFRHSFNS